MARRTSLAIVFPLLLAAGAATAQDGDATRLAKKLQNPLADIVSVPFQYNANFNVGPERDSAGLLNIQPVVPVALGANWNLITRTVVPLLSQPVSGTGAGRTYGVGDIQLSGFLSPRTVGRFVWGVGGIVQAPTASDDRLGTDQWGLGPTAVVLTISGPWVLGALANNVFGLGSPDDPGDEDLNAFLLQPFINYNFPNHPGRYLTFSPIITANWKADSGDQWTVPLGLGIGQIVKAGKLPINLQAGYYYNVVSPDFGPDYQIRLQVQLAFPK